MNLAPIEETVVTFGKNESQLGILTPTKDPKGSERPTFILLNAGIVHHIGPYRSTVDLSRRLEKSGFSSFRFDLSGLGDSESRQDQQSDRERACFDIDAALNHLEKTYSIKKFVLYGLCSGADNGHLVAVRDPRIVGCVFLDGFFYTTLGYHFHYYWSRIIDFSRWKSVFFRVVRFIQSILSSFLHPKPHEENLNVTRTFVREFPNQKQVEGEIQQLIDRNVELLYIYSGGTINHINYKGQFRAMFPRLRWKSNIEMEYRPTSDHTYSLLEGREWLQQRILTWCEKF